MSLRILQVAIGIYPAPFYGDPPHLVVNNNCPNATKIAKDFLAIKINPLIKNDKLLRMGKIIIKEINDINNKGIDF